MQELMSARVSDGFIILCGMGLGLVSIIGTILVAMSIVTAIYKRRTQLDDMEATLKMEMINRGMSAEDIERVLRAKMGTSDRKSLTELVGSATASRKGMPWNQPVAGR